MTHTLPHEWVEIHAGANPDAPAATFAADSISYGELNRLANEHAGALLDEGVAPGDAVPFVATLTRETIVALVAIPLAGAVPAPYGPHRVDVIGAATENAYAIVSTSGSRHKKSSDSRKKALLFRNLCGKKSEYASRIAVSYDRIASFSRPRAS